MTGKKRTASSRPTPSASKAVIVSSTGLTREEQSQASQSSLQYVGKDVKKTVRDKQVTGFVVCFQHLVPPQRPGQPIEHTYRVLWDHGDDLLQTEIFSAAGMTRLMSGQYIPEGLPGTEPCPIQQDQPSIPLPTEPVQICPQLPGADKAKLLYVGNGKCVQLATGAASRATKRKRAKAVNDAATQAAGGQAGVLLMEETGAAVSKQDAPPPTPMEATSPPSARRKTGQAMAMADELPCMEPPAEPSGSPSCCEPQRPAEPASETPMQWNATATHTLPRSTRRTAAMPVEPCSVDALTSPTPKQSARQQAKQEAKRVETNKPAYRVVGKHRFPAAWCYKEGDKTIDEAAVEEYDHDQEWEVERIIAEFKRNKKTVYWVKFKGYEFNPKEISSRSDLANSKELLADWERKKEEYRAQCQELLELP